MLQHGAEQRRVSSAQCLSNSPVSIFHITHCCWVVECAGSHLTVGCGDETQYLLMYLPFLGSPQPLSSCCIYSNDVAPTPWEIFGYLTQPTHLDIPAEAAGKVSLLVFPCDEQDKVFGGHRLVYFVHSACCGKPPRGTSLHQMSFFSINSCHNERTRTVKPRRPNIQQ